MYRRISLIGMFFLASFGSTIALRGEPRPTAVDPGNPPSSLVQQIRRDLAREKEGQLKAASAADGFTIHPKHLRIFKGMIAGDDAAVSNVYAWIRPRIGQYERGPGDPDVDALLSNEAWQYVLEAHGAWGEFKNWSPDLLCLYADMMLGSMPADSIYFGGTDPGRFVITAFNDTVWSNRVFVITQNALADNHYMAYVRRLYGKQLAIPTTEDSTQSFQRYVDEVQSGKRPGGAGLSFANGRVTITGVEGVMQINGLLAEVIFERNRDRHPIFVEESYVIGWMYPHLTPAGLIMKLNPGRPEITDEMALADREFWDATEKKLRDRPAFASDFAAQKTFSKLRSAIGGLYVARGRTNDAERAFQQAIRLFPESPEASYRLAQSVLLAGGRTSEARDVMTEFRKRLPHYAEICAREGNPVRLADEEQKVDRLLSSMRDAHRK